MTITADGNNDVIELDMTFSIDWQVVIKIRALTKSSFKTLMLTALVGALFSLFIGVAANAQQPSQSDRVFEDAYQEVLKDPGNLDKSFRFTQLAIERGDFEAAVSALERMLITNPNLPRGAARAWSALF